MSESVVQTGRLLSMTTPLGADKLIPVLLSGEEGLSRPFRFTVEAVSADLSIAAGDLLGKSVTVSIAREGRDPRYVNGIVRRFEAGPAFVNGMRTYRLELVPSLWLLTLTSDCRVFQDNTVLEIAETVLREGGVSDYTKKGIGGTYAARAYCVQYRETDFAFLSRLFEDEGIFYHFRHDSGGHTLVLSDEPLGYDPCADSACAYAPADQGLSESIAHWLPAYSYRTGKWALGSYDFTAPGTSLLAKTSTALDNGAFKAWERYDYTGTYRTAGDGATASKMRMEEEEAGYEVVEGVGAYRAFAPGYTFTLAENSALADAGRTYVLRDVVHSARDHSHVGHGNEPPSYSNRFVCLPAETAFRPPRATPRPIVHGLETALVTGSSGEEIFCDEYGRIKVQFHWDRLGGKDDKSSCYIRVAQMMAGRNWGTQFIPRVGMEVLVAFLGGDPDQPLVVGSVYNGDNMPPYTLPANKTQSGIKTRSSKQGSSSTFNELRFEDKKDAEQIYVHAQKDFKRIVVNDDTLEVDHDQTVTVKNNQTVTVEKDQTVSVDGDRTTTVDGKDKLTIKGTHDVSVTGAETWTNSNAFTRKVSKDYTIDVSGNITIKASGNITIQAGGSLTLKSGSSMSATAGAAFTASAGSDATLKGTNAKVQASSSATVSGGASVTVKGSASGTFDGGGMATIKGGLIKLN